jgi:Protein of unknown function (DUF1214)/Protein of unknown function (DUF1254)
LTGVFRYGNNFANLGSLTSTPPGQYYITASCNAIQPSSFARTPASTLFTPAQEVMDHPPHERDPGDDPYQGYITMPTAYGIITLRILVENNTTDVDTVVAIQKGFTLSPIYRPESCAPTLTMDLLTSGIDGSFSQQILKLTARIASYNPPEVESDVDWVNATLELAGIVDNTYTTPKGVNLKEAEFEANKSVLATYYKRGVRDFYRNDWSAFSADVSGNFQSNYDVRALIASTGYLQLNATEAVYPIYDGSLGTKSAYMFTFSGKPPVNGFWSLTVYNSAYFLVDNPLNRYSLGDRSNITYPDGVPVYATPRDGPFQILLQAANREPHGKWLSK